VGRINPPKDLMLINPDSEKPYDFYLKDNKQKVKNNEKFIFAEKKFEKINGKMVNLALSKTFIDKNTKIPTYIFDVLLPKTNENVGKVTYGVVPKNDDFHFGNVEVNMTKDLDFRSIKYDCCQLIKQVANHHKASSLYLTCEPEDYDTRRVFDSLGAYLKEIKTITNFDSENKRTLVEKCIWVWEF